MVRIFYGRPLSGKTLKLTQLLEKSLQKGRRCFFIVPEQYTVFAEDRLLASIAPKLQRNLEVTNFKRLGSTAMDEAGIFQKVDFNDTAAIVRMYLSLCECADRLVYFKHSFENPDFLKGLISLYNEFVDYRTDLSLLEETAAGLDNDFTGRKLRDLAMIYNAFRHNIGESYKDTKEYYLEAISKVGYFVSSDVFIDDFFGFTPYENEILKLIIKQSDNVCFSFLTDNLNEKHKYSLFYDVNRNISRIKRFCDESGIPILFTEMAAPKLDAGFAEVEKYLFRYRQPVNNSSCNNISFYCADNPFDELKYACKTIKRLIRRDGLKYSDFAVICGETEYYKGIFEAEFKEHDIPFFNDDVSAVSSKPLSLFLLTLNRLFTSGFDTGSVITLFKTGLFSIDMETVNIFENYVYMWKMKPGQITSNKDWTKNPLSLDSEPDEAAACILERLNLFKREFLIPLKKYSGRYKTADGAEKVEILFEILDEYKIYVSIQKRTDYFKSIGEHSLYEEERQLWDIVTELLGTLHTALAEKNISGESFSSLLRVMLDSYTIGKLPFTRNEVLVSSVSKVKTDRKKCIFIVGVNDGLIPSRPSENSILNDKDKEILAALNLKLPPMSESYILQDRLNLYSLVLKATKQLFFSYHKISIEGKSASCSYIWNELLKIFPLNSVIDSETDPYADTPESLSGAFTLLSELEYADPGSREQITQLLEKQPGFVQYQSRVGSLRSIMNPGRLNPENTRNVLFRENLSYSAVSLYNKCAFSYFCRYGLGLKKNESFSVEAREVGLLIHYCLEKVLKYGNGEKPFIELTADEINICVRKNADIFIAGSLSAAEELSGKFTYLFKRLVGYLCELLVSMKEEFEASAFKPVDFELQIGGPASEIEPLSFEAGDGKINMLGAVDRVDCYKLDDTNYIRIVDYKTGNTTFRLSDILNGINLQMYIYLYTILKNGQSRYDGKLMPAGILYKKGFEGFESVEKRDTETEKTDTKNVSGLLIDDTDILHAMEKNPGERFLPVTFTSKGLSVRSSVASLTNFNRVWSYIENLIIKIGNEISEGCIKIYPFDDDENNISSCKYCDYSGICCYIPLQKRKYRKLSETNPWDDFDKGGEDR